MGFDLPAFCDAPKQYLNKHLKEAQRRLSLSIRISPARAPDHINVVSTLCMHGGLFGKSRAGGGTSHYLSMLFIETSAASTSRSDGAGVAAGSNREKVRARINDKRAKVVLRLSPSRDKLWLFYSYDRRDVHETLMCDAPRGCYMDASVHVTCSVHVHVMCMCMCM